MPQAKQKARFIIIGKFINAKGEPVKAGSLIDLEVGEDGKPVDGLLTSRVKPFKGDVIGGDAHVEAAAITEAAGKEAERIINEATAAAAQILADAKKK